MPMPPMFRAPTAFSDAASTFAEGASSRLEGFIKSRESDANVFRTLLNNAPELAKVAGSGVLDRISALPIAGANPAVFGGPDATWADQAYRDLTRATIGELDRRGTGTGSDSDGPKTDESTVGMYDKDNNLIGTQTIKTKDYDVWRNNVPNGVSYTKLLPGYAGGVGGSAVGSAGGDTFTGGGGDAAFNALVAGESGGDYTAVSSKGALGVGQIMPANIAPWSREVMPQQVVGLTDEQIKARYAQDSVFQTQLAQTKFNQLVQRHGVQNAFSIWHSGRPYDQVVGHPEINDGAITTEQYVANAMKRYMANGGGAAGTGGEHQPQTTQTADASGVTLPATPHIDTGAIAGTAETATATPGSATVHDRVRAKLEASGWEVQVNDQGTMQVRPRGSLDDNAWEDVL